jgi:hypothetical protein
MRDGFVAGHGHFRIVDGRRLYTKIHDDTGTWRSANRLWVSA